MVAKYQKGYWRDSHKMSHMLQTKGTACWAIDAITTARASLAKDSHRFVWTEEGELSFSGGLLFSLYIEVAKLTSTTAASVISHLKSILSRHGIPETVMSDNGPQYSASVFTSFAEEYGFKRITSSLKYPQANGAAERAVKTVKQLLEKNSDPYLSMLAYRSTPL